MSRKIALIVLAIVVIILPISIASLFVFARFGVSLEAFTPFWSDELFHWHQSLSFAEVGWANGYYTLNDNIPTFAFSHYYSWGAWIYVYYGTIARFFDYNLATFTFINAATFMLATGVFIALIRPTFERLLLLGAILATFVPLIQYIPSAMPLVFQLSISLLIAGGFYRVLSGEVSARFVTVFTLYLMLVGLSRPTFTVFLFPLFVLASKNRNWKTILRAIIVSVPLTIISAIGFYLSAAPFPHFRTRLFLDAGTLGEKAQRIWEYLKLTMGWLRTDGDAPTFALRYHVLLLVALLIGWGIFIIWQWRRADHKAGESKPLLWEVMFHLFNLLGFYAIILLFHEALGGHDYRVMAPHLFISLLVLVAMRRRYLVLIMAIASLLAFPALWGLFEQKTPNFNLIGQQQFDHWQPILADAISYDADASNAWCNTLALSEYYTRPYGGEAGLLLAIPAGIGVSWYYNWDDSGRYAVPEQLKARYLMLHQSDFTNWQDRLNVREIIPVQDGALYDNLDSACYNNGQ